MINWSMQFSPTQIDMFSLEDFSPTQNPSIMFLFLHLHFRIANKNWIGRNWQINYYEFSCQFHTVSRFSVTVPQKARDNTQLNKFFRSKGLLGSEKLWRKWCFHQKHMFHITTTTDTILGLDCGIIQILLRNLLNILQKSCKTTVINL